MNEGSSGTKAEKVAIVAVHGISDQKPFASAREIANLLINPNPDKEYNSRFSTFKERFVRFLVKPLTLNQVADDQADIEFTKDQLEGYEKTSLYQTICLEGESDDKSQEVHVYEMFWADLSRLGESFFRIFGELYQILFHLSKVGSKTAELAKENQNFVNRDNWFISCWVGTQKFCSYLLSSIIPILNIYFLIAVFLSMPINTIIERLTKDENTYPNFLDSYEDKIVILTLVLIGLFAAFVFSKIALFKGRSLSKRIEKRNRPTREFFNITSWLFQFVVGALFAVAIKYDMFSFLDKASSFFSNLSKEEIIAYLIILAWVSVLIALLWFTLIKSFNEKQPGISNLFALSGINLLIMHLVKMIFITKSTNDNSTQLLGGYLIIGLVLFILASLIVNWFREKDNNDEQQNKARRDIVPGITRSGLVISLSLVIGAYLVYLYRIQEPFLKIISLENTERLLTINKLITTFSLNIIEVIYFCLYIAWFLFIGSYLISLFSGLIVLFFGKANTQKSPTKQNDSYIDESTESYEKLKLLRAFGISIASLILPASLFLFTSLTIWSALNNLGSRFIYGIEQYKPIIFRGLTWAIYGSKNPTSGLTKYCLDNGTDISALEKPIPGSDCFLQLISDFSTSDQANFSFLFFGIVLLLAIWTLFPAILSDVFPPDKESTSKDSWGLGNWLTNGYTVLVWSFLILVCICIPIAAVIGYSSVWSDFFIRLKDEPISSPFLQIPALFLTVSAGTLIALGATLNKISLGLRGVLDAALDVDNYLREEPDDDTPKAKIFARYTSLLRYIYDRPIEDQYDAIIIVAHSQGTVISADLLRYLNQDFLKRGLKSSALTEEFRAYNAYDLQVCDSPSSRVKYYCEIPQQEFIIAKKDIDEDIYHIHIFDKDGKKVVYRILSALADEGLVQELDSHKNKIIDDQTKRKLIRKIILSLGAVRVPNIYLFTMGSPIKQLYSFSFPHLYHWVYNSSNENSNPNPAELLNVEQWVNAYRSGDYVGRYLWHEPSSNPEFRKRWDRVKLFPKNASDWNYEQSNIYSPDIEKNPDNKRDQETVEKSKTKEFCIGAGGHTHYWDETAPEIAIELDRLIRDASK